MGVVSDYEGQIVSVRYRLRTGAESAGRAIVREGTCFEIRTEMDFIQDRTVCLYPIPKQNIIDVLPPQPARLSQIEEALVKASREQQEKVTVSMRVEKKFTHPNI